MILQPFKCTSLHSSTMAWNFSHEILQISWCSSYLNYQQLVNELIVDQILLLIQLFSLLCVYKLISTGYFVASINNLRIAPQIKHVVI